MKNFFPSKFDDKLLKEEYLLIKYSYDESPIKGKIPEFVFLPEKNEDLSEFVKFCFKKNIYITPRGGGTGLSGGSVPLKGGVISFERMNKIIDVDFVNQTITLEPGVITGDINKVLLRENLFYPPDPLSLDSCTIGGNIATNAGGPRAYKYGVTSNYLIELECVLPNGSIVNIGRGTRKWKTGYNLLNLLCSSEGTLALFTKIKLKLIPRPEKEVLMVMSFGRNENLFNFVINLIKNKFFPSIIEFMDKGCVGLVKEKIKEYFPEESSLLFIGFDGSEKEIESLLEKFYHLVEKEKIEKIFIGDDKSSVERIWDIRKKMFYETEKKGFKVHSEDICLTITTAQNFIEDVKNLFQIYKKEPYIFGHLGDGNIHINLTYKEEEKKSVREISEKIWELVIKRGGTITAEHGVGYLKKRGFKKETNPFLYKIQRDIKRIFDPKGILNPGKIF
ncbi:MAG: FAD-linked oxidase C-terminal domain-containing protein [Candidatus Hydrothermales bacterium]